jgi:hypothetical protein
MTHTPDANLEDVDIVNRALARFGAPPLITLDDESDLAQAAQLIYLTKVESALGKLHWRFAAKTFKLNRLDIVPDSGWRYAYQLPGGALGLPEKFMPIARRPDLVLRDFEIEAGEVHCDVDALWARCTVMVPPTLWPPEFREAVIVGVAAALCVPISHDTTLADKLQREAYGDPREGGTGGLLGRAIANEVASAPPRADMGSENPLTDARW